MMYQAGLSDQVKLLVVSISEQTRASFAASFNENPSLVFQKLTNFFEGHLGFDYVFDSSFARDLSLIESAREFVTRYQEKQQLYSSSTPLPLLASSCPGKEFMKIKHYQTWNEIK
jgi:iron only hydrogenase large subunit-like protein